MLHQAESEKQPAEQQDFSSQEQPHTDLTGIELLLHGGKVMLMIRIMLTMLIMAAVGVNVRGGCTHDLVCNRLGPVIVGLVLQHRSVFEIVRDGRGGSLPLKGGSV